MSEATETPVPVELPITYEELTELLLSNKICGIISVTCSSWVLLSFCLFRSLRGSSLHLVAMLVSCLVSSARAASLG